MDLPVNPPVLPMLARPVSTIPRADGMRYEPKWDGFRCLVFRDGDEIVLGSRNTRPLNRYFPDLLAAVTANLPDRCVVDGEIVVRQGDRLDFDTLQLRIHPAASRVALLAEQTPASFVAFDVLALGGEDLREVPYAERRERLAGALAGAAPPIHLTTVTTDPDLAGQWFEQFEGAGLDGIVAKPADLPYVADKRLMYKVKHERTADCVVAGFRWHKSGEVVGSLLLGLYDGGGVLHHVGVSASFTAARRAELVAELAPYRMGDLAGHPWEGWSAEGAESRMPGAVSRWSAGKDLSWLPVRPELVCEVAYGGMEGDRFRHTAQFRRWRTDREPGTCTYTQLEEPVSYDLDKVLAG
jgi:ATP-dependent DNA ligase